jgi:chromatin structure-remodeling complex subunit RSC1/2
MVEEAPASPSASPKVEESVEVDPEVKEEQDIAEDGTVEAGTRAATSGEPVTNNQYKALKEITDKLTNHKITRRGDECADFQSALNHKRLIRRRNYYPSTLFRRIPNKRNLPDYHEIIKEPAAISTLKGKIQRKEYEDMKQPVRDFAMIVYNAQVYNRPNSAPVRDVLELKAVFEEELKKMVEKGLIVEEDTVFPDLGEIPYATPEPDPVSEEEEEGEDDEDDEDEDGDDSEDEKGKRGRRRGGPRGSLAGKKRDRSEEGQKGGEPKKRGRPPKVDTPMEARIKAVLKGIRKPKDKAGQLKIRHFERLPDKSTNLDYFQSIKEPIAIDLIKKKSKRKKYQSLEHLMRDLDLMFKNAMDYNLDESDIYKDAVDLQNEAHKLADAERKRPDSDYMDEDGRIPLPDGILHGSEIYKVGDWIHIQNQNDVTKPIVAQIYRTWQDTEGQKWINACWYYRPEQTVHQFEKHFYPNEVVKTGQYRDHQVEEIVDRCFVMFFTRYSRGRPRNLDPRKEVYVCEARYNEEKHKLNKIKTWASCLPDEVRDKDYEMDLFDQPRKVKKVPSPLLHLLRDDQKDGDDPPEPEFKHPNAPPVVGAIYRGPRDENVSTAIVEDFTVYCLVTWPMNRHRVFVRSLS